MLPFMAVTRGAKWRVAQAVVCSFLLAAPIDVRIPLLQYTATYRDDGTRLFAETSEQLSAALAE